LKLKVGFVVIPMRSIGKTIGLSNDIRLIITTDIGKNTIVVTVIKRKLKKIG
jgi:hypothetical protein